jgi:hypothetical protein
VVEVNDADDCIIWCHPVDPDKTLDFDSRQCLSHSILVVLRWVVHSMSNCAPMHHARLVGLCKTCTHLQFPANSHDLSDLVTLLTHPASHSTKDLDEELPIQPL